MFFIKILSGLAFIASVAWYSQQRGYDSGIAVITTLSAFIAAWIGDKKIKRKANQSQTVAERGIGIQAGGDVNTGNINVSGKDKNA